MASRTSSALLLLALFGVALFLQVALVDGASDGELTSVSKNVNVDSNMSPSGDTDLTEQVEDIGDDQRPDMTDQGMSEVDQVGEEPGQRIEIAQEDDIVDTMRDSVNEIGEIQPYVYVPGADEVEVILDFADDELDQQQSESTPVAAHPFSRILHESTSKKCMWSSKECKKFYRWAGCCSKQCVDLSNNNRHCGRCNKCCDTKRGYFCHSGKCAKRHSDSCTTKTCKGGNSCCKGKCVNLKQDCKNCGKCNSNCPWGSACCSGKCKNLKTDCKNCGQCGRHCGKGQVCCNGRCISLNQNSGHCGACGNACVWGRKCCQGKCVSVMSDKSNCGRCGKKCERNVKCKFGICGYGHY